MFVARHHSHSKAPPIKGALQNAIANVRSDDTKTDWVLCGFVGGEDIKYLGSGAGGIEALKAKLVEWDVCYGLVRCTHTLEQAGHVQTDFVKFVWIYWRPDNIPVMRKMTIGVNEGEMKRRFAPYHAELQACSMDELGPGQIEDILDTVTMRADKTGTNIERAPSTQTLLEKGRKAWALARGSLPAIHFAHFAIADEQKKMAESGKVKLEDEESLAKAIRDIRSDVSRTDWCLAGYKDSNVLEMIGAGEGGLEALLDATEPFGVNYGVLRVAEKLDLVYHEAYCFITWMPENVPAFVKARVSIHQGAVAAAFRKHVHCQFYFRGAEREDITLDIIRARIRQIIGKGTDGARRKKKTAMGESTTSQVSSPGQAPPIRPKYVAAKAQNNSLRGSIVIKADAITAASPSAEEKKHFPKIFLDSLTMKRAAPAATNSRSGAVAEMGIIEDGETEEEFADEESPVTGVRDNQANNKNEPKVVLTTVQEAVERVKRGGEGADYLVVEWTRQGKIGEPLPDELKIKEMGSGGVEALADCFESQSTMYGLVRLTERRSTVKNETYCSMKCTPESAPTEEDGNVGTLQGKISRLFQPFHENLNTKHPSVVTTAESANARVSRRKQ